MMDGESPKASAAQMAMVGCSIIWIIGTALIICFLIALGTLACGNMCDKMVPLWFGTAAAAVLLFGFCIWLTIAMVRRQIPRGLFASAIGIDVILLAVLAVFATYLGL